MLRAFGGLCYFHCCSVDPLMHSEVPSPVQVNVVYKKCEVLQDRVPKVQQQVGDKIDRAVLWLRNVEHKDDPGVNAAWMKRRLQLAEFEFDAMQSSLRDELTRTMDMQRALQKLQSDMIRFVSGKEKDKGARPATLQTQENVHQEPDAARERESESWKPQGVYPDYSGFSVSRNLQATNPNLQVEGS